MSYFEYLNRLIVAKSPRSMSQNRERALYAKQGGYVQVTFTLRSRGEHELSAYKSTNYKRPRSRTFKLRSRGMPRHVQPVTPLKGDVNVRGMAERDAKS